MRILPKCASVVAGDHPPRARRRLDPLVECADHLGVRARTTPLPRVAALLVGFVSLAGCVQNDRESSEQTTAGPLAAPTGAADAPADAADAAAPAGTGTDNDPNANPRESATVCRRALRCSAECYEQARGGFQSLAECAEPDSEACKSARRALAQSAPPLPVTLQALGCATRCEAQARSLDDLRDVDAPQWEKLDEIERGAWTGIIAGADCHPDAECASVCDGAYPVPQSIARRAEREAKARAQSEAQSNASE